MRLMLRGAAFVVVCWQATLILARDPAPADTAANLVRSALRAELGGNAQERSRLLSDALEVDPEFAPARWHSGQVRVDKRWLPITDVPHQTARDAQLNAYRKRRDALIDTADQQRDLARWCKRVRLEEEAAVHWWGVLTFLPNDVEAIRELRLQKYHGRMLTPYELSLVRRHEVAQTAATRRWQGQLTQWREDLLNGTTESRRAALEGLRSVRDPAAIPALEKVLLGGAFDERRSELYAAFVSAVAEMPDEEATQTLLRLALAGDADQAARALRGRPLASFVPQLIEAFPSEVVYSGSATFGYLPDGTVFQEHAVTKSIPEEDASVTKVFRDTEYFYSRMRRNPQIVARMNRAVANAADFQRNVAAEQQAVSQVVSKRKQHIEKILLAATDFERVETRQEWLAQFTLALESYTPSRLQQPEPTRVEQVYEQTRLLTLSCFPAGTPVETLLGPTAIETLKPGDRVLSQNPETGELAYQSVREVTLRPAASLIEIELAGGTIRCTRGHPFWVNGKGWLMAKELRVGQQLHGIDGGHRIDRLEELSPQVAYNLVVSDFATYFVGSSHVLVHDNQPLAGTATLVPGLAPMTRVP